MILDTCSRLYTSHIEESYIHKRNSSFTISIVSPVYRLIYKLRSSIDIMKRPGKENQVTPQQDAMVIKG